MKEGRGGGSWRERRKESGDDETIQNQIRKLRDSCGTAASLAHGGEKLFTSPRLLSLPSRENRIENEVEKLSRSRCRLSVAPCDSLPAQLS